MTNPSIEDIPYRTIAGKELLGRLYRPDVTGPAPYVVDVHGGTWGSGDRLNNESIHQDFVAHGIGVFALDFRLSSEAQFPAPVDDVNYGVRWFKANAQSIGANAGVIGGLGSSSGLQQMGLIALTPNEPLYTTPEASLSDVDASVAFLIALWPIFDPLARYRTAQAAGKERLVAAHNTYFPNEAAMTIGNPYLVLDRGEATHKPPTIVIQGAADENVEHTRADIFAERYRAAGGAIEVHKYEGRPHSFIANEPDTDSTKDAIEKIRNFVLAQA